MTAILWSTGRIKRPPVGLVYAWYIPASTTRGGSHKYYQSVTAGHRHHYPPASRSDSVNWRWHNNIKSTAISNTSPFQRRTFVHSSNGDDNSNDEAKSATPIPSIFSSSEWEASDWALHVAVSPEDAPIRAVEAIEKALKKFYSSNTFHEQQQDEDGNQDDNQQYTAEELLHLGAAWYLPAEDMDNPYKKPTRLASEQEEVCDLELQEGDYLRIHHNPRRFPAVDLYDWTLPSTSSSGGGNDNMSTTSSEKECLVVEYNAEKGFLVLNKPSECIPVHMTVDNSAENIVSCLRQANPELDYVTTPHRLDQNTSGLIALATSKPFAAYFAKLMRHKTASEVPPDSGNSPTSKDHAAPVSDNNKSLNNNDTGVHKAYRCLVCLIPPPDDKTWSVDKALRQLQSYAIEHKVMRHFLEPSVRAPKRFVATLPENASTIADNANNKKSSEAGWAECLLRIQRVGDVCALRGNAASDGLAQALWNSSQELMPPAAQAVVEVDIELLTGRTHQIRGQLSAAGYPLAGDVPYGGAVPANEMVPHESNYKSRLALQCRRLEFLDPDVLTVKKKKRGHINVVTDMTPSIRWNAFEVETAWWTPFLSQYHEAMKQTSEEEMTTMAALDIGLLDSSPHSGKKAATAIELNPQGLPPQAVLSPGRHKYVIVKAIDPNSGEIYKWFVKSASLQECGGPYHRDVAGDLVEWIEACGYRAIVTGGGRILYEEGTQRALVYGFSYGYGRGDHALAAKVIQEWSDRTIDSAYDDSPDLY